MTLMRFRRDPFFSQLASLQDNLNRGFEGLFTPPAEGELPSRDFMPPMDISEDAVNYTVKTEVPGMKAEDIKIDLTGRTLTLKGEKKQESETEDENWHRVERSYGSWLRRVEMPQAVDPEKIVAQYDDGVLTVRVAKAEEVKPRKIEVKTSDR
jgi:HSP20 family protein